jgi:hypothetical protein
MPPTRFKTVILCEHITVDVGYKHSLIGVYSGDIVIPDFPANLRLAFYSEMVPPADGEHTIVLTFKINDKKFMEGRVSVSNAVAGESGIIAVRGFSLETSEPVTLTIDARVNDEETQTLSSKKIYRAEKANPNAPSQPVSQSLSASPD